MQYRHLGASGPVVSVLGLGLAALGRPGYINLGHGEDLRNRTDPQALEAHTHSILDAAFDAGITYFDAARSYGRAEEFLAHWLDRRRPTGVSVGSKWGYVYTADWQIGAEVHEEKNLTRENLDRQYALSHGLLGDHMALYQIHSATLESGVLENRRVLERLAELRQSGLIIGFSTSGADQSSTIRRALGVQIGDTPLFQQVQATWNLLEPSTDAALQEAADAGLGVIVKEAVGNGRLTPRQPATGERLGLSDTGFDVDAVAIAAALQRPWASVVLSGATTVTQLSANLQALEVPAELIGSLPSIAEDPQAYWGARSLLTWG